MRRAIIEPRPLRISGGVVFDGREIEAVGPATLLPGDVDIPYGVDRDRKSAIFSGAGSGMSCDPFLSDLRMRGCEGSEEREEGEPTRANQTDASKHGGLLEQVVVGVGKR